jgi:hypothetical protein
MHHHMYIHGSVQIRETAIEEAKSKLAMQYNPQGPFTARTK